MNDKYKLYFDNLVKKSENGPCPVCGVNKSKLFDLQKRLVILNEFIKDLEYLEEKFK